MSFISHSQCCEQASFENFAKFPVEVVRLILECAAWDSGLTAARIARVSSLVQSWILPLLYETVILTRVTDLRQIQHNLTKKARLIDYVHNVCLALECDKSSTAGIQLTEDIAAFISQCPNISSVYLNSTSLPLCYDAAKFPSLKYLHCGSWDAWMTHDVLAFRSITHLRVDLVHNCGVHPSWEPLLSLPNTLPHLTHLALGADARAPPSEARVTAQFLRSMLAARAQLVILVVTLWYCFGESGDAMFMDISDPRLCVLRTPWCPDSVTSLSEWEDHARGGNNLWEKSRKAASSP